eukprot:12269651-Ditylum_brightwellii.AAC.1
MLLGLSKHAVSVFVVLAAFAAMAMAFADNHHHDIFNLILDHSPDNENQQTKRQNKTECLIFLIGYGCCV